MGVLLRRNNRPRFSLSARTYLTLNSFDKLLGKPAVRIGNHGAALATLAYFGVISAAMTPMAMPPMLSPLAAAITARVGSTSNAAFSEIFGTLVTPASFVFLIWPVIAVLQLATLAVSIVRPGRSFRRLPRALNRFAGAPLAQTELTSLSLANACAATWLVVASQASARSLPLGSLAVLPLVPLFSGLPLRSSTPNAAYRPLFQVFSSFTTIASLLALTIELQHGGRVPWLMGRAEPCAMAFVTGALALVALPGQSLLRQVVNVLAFTGILWKRLAPAVLPWLPTTAVAARRAAIRPPLVAALSPALQSVSFWGMATVWAWAVAKLGRTIWQSVRRQPYKSAWKLAEERRRKDGPPPPPAPDFGDRGVFF